MDKFKYENLKMKDGVFFDIQKFKFFNTKEYHCGYIFLNLKKRYPELESIIKEQVEITFDQNITLNGENYRVLGFDTAHYYNFENPETQTYNAAENEIYNIIEKWNDFMKNDNYGRK